MSGQALMPEWMSLREPKEAPSQATKRNVRERGGMQRHGRQHSYHHLSYLPSERESSSHYQQHDWRPSPLDANPRILNRSKSSPGFDSPASPDRVSSPPFDRNFPPPSNTKPKTKSKPHSHSMNMCGKSVSQPNLFSDKSPNSHHRSVPQSPLAASSVPPTTTTTTTTTTIPHNPTHIVTDEMDKLRQLVPSVTVPKSVRVRALVGPPPPLKKVQPPTVSPSNASHSNGAVSPLSYFRKATSEPCLTNLPNKASSPTTEQEALAQARRTDPAFLRRLTSMRTDKAQANLLREAREGAVSKDKVALDRNNFFQHVIKNEEQQGKRVRICERSESDSPEQEECDRSQIAAVEELPATSDDNDDREPKTPLPVSIEDEERFLRTLGWLPEDEQPVPELNDEEIAETIERINKHGNGLLLSPNKARREVPNK